MKSVIKKIVFIGIVGLAGVMTAAAQDNDPKKPAPPKPPPPVIKPAPKPTPKPDSTTHLVDARFGMVKEQSQ